MYTKFPVTRYHKDTDRLYVMFNRYCGHVYCTVEHPAPYIEVFRQDDTGRIAGFTIHNFSKTCDIAHDAFPEYAQYFSKEDMGE